MRRKDKEVSRDLALEIIDRCNYGTLATIGEHVYAVPVSMARDGEVLYFHGAKEGHKATNLNQNPNCCVSFVGQTNIPKGEFDISYESAIVFGKAIEVIENGEKIHALKVISEKYTPNNMANFDKVVEGAISRVAVWKISIDTVTGKKG